MEQLHPLAKQAGALLIEDSAQAFPSGDEQGIWQGDLVVLSFGRGKPVSLLGGGAVLCGKDGSGDSALAKLLPESTLQADASMQQQISFGLKAMLYNWMINPRLYWLPQALPFLHLNETRYHALISLEGMDRIKSSMLSSNIKAYQNDPMDTQKSVVTMLGELDLERHAITDLPKVCEISKERRLLRYPLLVESGTRDLLYARLRKLGLGPSRMYQAVLPEISGLESLLSRQEAFPAASSFAQRLLTLPIHQQVSQADIIKMCQALSH